MSNYGMPVHCGNVVAIYNYHDEAWHVRHRAVESGGNVIYQQSDGKGGWLRGVEGVQLLLYNLPALIKARIVLVVATERHANQVQKAAACFPGGNDQFSYIATTCIGGPQQWQDRYAQYLAGKEVYVFGSRRDAAIQRVCQSVAQYAQCVYLADIGDVSELIRVDGDSGLYRAIQRAPRWGSVEARDVYRAHDLRQQQERAATDIIAYLKTLSQDGTTTELEILKHVQGEQQIKVRALRALVRRQRVHRAGRGAKGDPFRYSSREPAPPDWLRRK